MGSRRAVVSGLPVILVTFAALAVTSGFLIGASSRSRPFGHRSRSHVRRWPLRRPPPRVGVPVVALVVLVVVGVPWGVPAAVAAGWWAHRRLGAAGVSRPSELRREEADLAIVAALLAAAIEAGAPVRSAVAAVGAAVPGPVGDRLARAAAQSALGVAPVTAWAGASVDARPLIIRLMSMVGAAESGGLPPIEALRGLSEAARASAAARDAEAVRGAGIKAVAPLGLCFLPAFVLVGIVPVAAGAFHGLAL